MNSRLTSIAGSARMRQHFQPLPPIAEDPAAFAAEVERRINTVREEASDARDRTEDETEARERTIRGLRQEVTGELDQVREMSRTAAVGGLAQQVFGWLLVLVGVAVGTLGNALQALG